MEEKTLKGWSQFCDFSGKGSWTDYCLPGERVSEDVVDYFRNVMPPIFTASRYLQVGEPYDHRTDYLSGKVKPIYMTFQRYEGGPWIYEGLCFKREDTDISRMIDYGDVKTYLKEMKLLETRHKVRPRIVCKDGFTVSVQASAFHYCTPRDDLADGNYTNVEVGYPSQPESMLEQYAENPDDPCNTVYGDVPIEIVDAVIQKHGGFFESRPVSI